MKQYFGIMVFTLFAIVCIPVAAQTTAFSYQGHLKNGSNAANGNFEMEFKLFDTFKGGKQIGKTVTDPSVAVINGIFTTVLDFGAAPFDGGPARFLEIGIRPVGDQDPFRSLAPRQEMRSAPFAIQARQALAADNATNALQLGGVDASEYVTTTSVGNSFIKNDTTLQPKSNFNISGKGKVGDSLGIGVDPFPGVKLDVNGTTVIRTTGTGGNIQLGSPNAETGMSVIGANRADVRFNGSTLKLVAGPGTTPPLLTNGITIDTLGNVGIGKTTAPNSSDAKLNVVGNVTQDRASNGLVKAMVYVRSDGFIIRCYNGVTNSSTGNCGFSIAHDSIGQYVINFGFQVSDRFVTVTNALTSNFDTFSSFEFIGPPPDFVRVRTWSPNPPTPATPMDINFMIIIY